MERYRLGERAYARLPFVPEPAGARGFYGRHENEHLPPRYQMNCGCVAHAQAAPPEPIEAALAGRRPMERDRPFIYMLGRCANPPGYFFKVVFAICQAKGLAEYYGAFASPHKCNLADCGGRQCKNRVGALRACHDCDNRECLCPCNPISRGGGSGSAGNRPCGCYPAQGVKRRKTIG